MAATGKKMVYKLADKRPERDDDDDDDSEDDLFGQAPKVDKSALWEAAAASAAANPGDEGDAASGGKKKAPWRQRFALEKPVAQQQLLESLPAAESAAKLRESELRAHYSFRCAQSDLAHLATHFGSADKIRLAMDNGHVEVTFRNEADRQLALKNPAVFKQMVKAIRTENFRSSLSSDQGLMITFPQLGALATENFPGKDETTTPATPFGAVCASLDPRSANQQLLDRNMSEQSLDVLATSAGATADDFANMYSQWGDTPDAVIDTDTPIVFAYNNHPDRLAQQDRFPELTPNMGAAKVADGLRIAQAAHKELETMMSNHIVLSNLFGNNALDAEVTLKAVMRWNPDTGLNEAKPTSFAALNAGGQTATEWKQTFAANPKALKAVERGERKALGKDFSISFDAVFTYIQPLPQ